MHSFYWATILIVQTCWKVGYATECYCQPRSRTDVLLQQLEGLWYMVAMVNETNVSELRSCVTMEYKYDYCRGVAVVTRTSIPNNSTEFVSNTTPFGMITPGIIDVTIIEDNIEVNFHDHYMEFSPAESFIQTTCRRDNQTIYTDRVALFMSTRSVDVETIRARFNSVGISIEGNNQFYRVPQDNCSN